MAPPIRDLVGQTFTRLTVLELLPDRDRFGKLVYRCRCSCGTVKSVRGQDLVQKIHNTKSCGCLKKMEKLPDLTGRRFGRLVVLGRRKRAENDQGPVQYLCRCDCGRPKAVRSTDLAHGVVKSCGCLAKSFRGVGNLKRYMEEQRSASIVDNRHDRVSLAGTKSRMEGLQPD